jgi:hypothetical protein
MAATVWGQFMSGESYLIEIFLPLADNLGRGFPPAKFAKSRKN